jgi:hypothetical protein
MNQKTTMPSIVCHLGDPRTAKPQTLKEYGKLREKLIQQPWTCISETNFVDAVCNKGTPFYQALMNFRDLMELNFERLCWRLQVLAGADFDKCEVSVLEMVKHFTSLGMKPFLAYNSFSHNSSTGLNNYRLLWRVECDLSLTYDQSHAALRKIRELSGNLSDKNASNNTRLWQGTRSGAVHYDTNAPQLNLRKLIVR